MRRKTWQEKVTQGVNEGRQAPSFMPEQVIDVDVYYAGEERNIDMELINREDKITTYQGIIDEYQYVVDKSTDIGQREYASQQIKDVAPKLNKLKQEQIDLLKQKEDVLLKREVLKEEVERLGNTWPGVLLNTPTSPVGVAVNVAKNTALAKQAAENLDKPKASLLDYVKVKSYSRGTEKVKAHTRHFPSKKGEE